ncbi:MAG: hypothetical protein WD904_14445 [Dehalococcoidia bacterium]
MKPFLLGVIVSVGLVIPSLGALQASAFHPFHEPVRHLSDYHDALPNVSWGVSSCCIPDPTSAVNGFIEEPGGWQSASGGLLVDYYQTTYATGDFQISFITPSAIDGKCGVTAVACVTYESGYTCVGDCSYTLYHVSKLQIWFETTYWDGAATNTRRQVLDHEIGHTFGFAEHYTNDPVRGSV